MSAETDHRPEATSLPDTVAGIHDAAARVNSLREQGRTWAQVSSVTGYTRVYCMQLVYNLFELTDALNREQKPEGVMLAGVYTRTAAA